MEPKLFRSNFDPQSYRKNVDSLFPGGILTLISIIQGVAFGILVSNLFPLEKENLWPILYSTISIINLSIVVYEYMWFVGLFSGHVTIVDIIVVFLLGVFEVAPSYYMKQESAVTWWTLNAIFCLAGILGFTNSIRKTGLINYPDTVRTLLLRNLKINRWISFFAFILSFYVIIVIVVADTPDIEIAQIFTMSTWFLLGGFIVHKDQNFLNEVERKCIKQLKDKNEIKNRVNGRD